MPDDVRSDVAVLVVDDRAADRLAIEVTLAAGPYAVVTAKSGDEALRKLLDRDFAVILLDVRMPGMDGLEVAKLIKQRERSRHTPIVFLTAADPDLRLLYRGYSAGAVDYLSKPIDPDVLRAKVAIFVDLFEKDRRIRVQAEALREADRRDRERELASVVTAGQRRYEALADAMPDIVWIAAPDGSLVHANRRWTETTGIGFEETRAGGIIRALDPADVETFTARWGDARRAESTLDVECRLVLPDGTRRWHLCRAVPERDAEGRIVAWLGTLTDHDDLHRALDAAESAVRDRDAFLSLASHELRTPITTLRLRLRSAERRLPASDAELGRMVGSAIRQSDRLARLVDDLLDVSRIATGQLTIQREDVDLVAAVGDVVDRFAEAAKEAACELRLHAPVPIRGRWDRLRVEQAVQNLVGNALRHARGAPVELSVLPEGEDAVIRVRDHGPGIPERDLERVFDRFERATRGRHVDGLGLGLYLVRAIVQAHGGTAVAAHGDGGGALVTLRLPREATGVVPRPPEDGTPKLLDELRTRVGGRRGPDPV